MDFCITIYYTRLRLRTMRGLCVRNSYNNNSQELILMIMKKYSPSNAKILQSIAQTRQKEPPFKKHKIRECQVILTKITLEKNN